jgi:lipopolysaccharide heptosyltransferase II
VSSAAKTYLKLAYLHLRRALLVAGARMLRLRPTPTVSAPAELRKILFIRTDRIGDMVLSTPALRAIKNAFPGAHLTVLASRSNAPLLRHDPHVDRVMVWAQDRLAAGPIGFMRQAARLAKAGYDAVIDPMTGHDLRPALVAGLSGAPIRIGYRGYGREVFFNRLCRMDGNRHIADLILETTRHLGAEPVRCLPHVHLLDEERDEASRWLTASGLGGRPMVAFHLGAHYASQRWPVDYFAELARRLLHDHDCDVLVIGGPGERDLVRSFRSSAGEGPVVCESVDLREMAAVVAQATALVCNNSGPLHIAAALDVPTLSFMGPTDRSRWMPLGLHHVVLRQDQLDCIGCNRGVCGRGDHACMRMIAPGTVLSELLSMLRQRHLRPARHSPAERSRSTGSLPMRNRRFGASGKPSISPL